VGSSRGFSTQTIPRIGMICKFYTAENQNYVGVDRAYVNRGSSVSIVSGYALDDRAIEVRSPA
jgi:hypothetical protein